MVDESSSPLASEPPVLSACREYRRCHHQDHKDRWFHLDPSGNVHRWHRRPVGNTVVVIRITRIDGSILITVIFTVGMCLQWCRYRIHQIARHHLGRKDRWFHLVIVEILESLPGSQGSMVVFTVGIAVRAASAIDVALVNVITIIVALVLEITHGPWGTRNVHSTGTTSSSSSRGHGVILPSDPRSLDAVAVIVGITGIDFLGVVVDHILARRRLSYPINRYAATLAGLNSTWILASLATVKMPSVPDHPSLSVLHDHPPGLPQRVDGIGHTITVVGQHLHAIIIERWIAAVTKDRKTNAIAPLLRRPTAPVRLGCWAQR